MSEGGENILDTICARFNSIQWHDSKLLDLQVLRDQKNSTDEARFEIQFLVNPKPGAYQWRKATLRFKDCTIIKLDLDLEGKRLCSDDISGALCTKESPLKESIKRNEIMLYNKNPLAGYLHFIIELIPPGGEINIFARDFELVVEGNK